MKKTIATFVMVAGLLGTVRVGECADAAAGAAAYQKKCQNCHGKEGEGSPKMEKQLKAKIHPLSDPEVQAKSDEEWRKQIVEGVGKMKPVKGLSEEDITNVIAHMRAMKK